MPVEHNTLGHVDVHEPKHITISTISDSGKVITNSSSTTGVSQYRRLNESDLDHTDITKNVFGWNDISDSVYTSGTPRAIAAAVRTQITNNGGSFQTDQTRLGTLWSGNQFLIDDVNSFYVIRFNFKATAAAAAGTPYVILVEVESANGPTVIVGHTQFIKGGGAMNNIMVSIPFYNGSFINNQSLKVFITPDTNINAYDFGFVIHRTYKEG